MRLLIPEVASDLLYKLASKELGSRTLITAAVKRVELDSHMIAVLNPQTMCQSLIALNLAGVDYGKEEFCAYASELCKGENLS